MLWSLNVENVGKKKLSIKCNHKVSKVFKPKISLDMIGRKKEGQAPYHCQIEIAKFLKITKN